MPDDLEPDATATAVADPADLPADPPTVSAPDGPTPEQFAAQEREARLRAEGEARAYREVATARPDPASAPPAAEDRIYTPAEIEAARMTGKYTPQQLGYEYQRYTEHVARQAAGQARDEERAAARERDLGARLAAHRETHPGIYEAQSPENLAVRRWIEARHGNPQDLAQQLMACDALYGAPRNGGGVATTARDVRREKTLGGGGGQPGSGAAPAADPLKGIPPDYVAAWRRTGAKLDDPKVAQRHADRYWASRHRGGQVRPT